MSSKPFSQLSPSPVPLHAQLREIVRERIRDGSYQAHAQLPAESAMSRQFGVSRITVRQALGDLQREGVILVRFARTGAIARSVDVEFFL